MAQIALPDVGLKSSVALQKQDSLREQSDGKQGDGGPIWAMNQGLMDSEESRDDTS
jgi:hypothetical protein